MYQNQVAVGDQNRSSQHFSTLPIRVVTQPLVTWSVLLKTTGESLRADCTLNVLLAAWRFWTPEAMPTQFCSLHYRSVDLPRPHYHAYSTKVILSHAARRPGRERQRGPCGRGALQITPCIAMSDARPAAPYSVNRRQSPGLRDRASMVLETKAAAAMSGTGDASDHTAFIDLAHVLADTAAAVTTPYFR